MVDMDRMSAAQRDRKELYPASAAMSLPQHFYSTDRPDFQMIQVCTRGACHAWVTLAIHNLFYVKKPASAKQDSNLKTKMG